MGGSDLYQVRIDGCLGTAYSSPFEGLTIERDEAGETVLSGPMLDQAGLQAVLAEILDFNLKLISVSRVKHAGPVAGTESSNP